MILVTGAAGYIGSHFVRYYLKQNPDSDLVALDNLSLGNKQSLDACTCVMSPGGIFRMVMIHVQCFIAITTLPRLTTGRPTSAYGYLASVRSFP